MFVACGIWCLADVSSVSPSSEQTAEERYWVRDCSTTAIDLGCYFGFTYLGFLGVCLNNT